ncbi:acyl-CoA N-acyltransferase [Gongronella butleri]|nr:acyl-CoA N-acyltransferase [Gongronella butleri]
MSNEFALFPFFLSIDLESFIFPIMISTINVYVKLGREILSWNDAVQQHPWLASERESYKNGAQPLACVATYYVADEGTKTLRDHVHIATFHDNYKRSFRQLNEAWVSRFFKMEKNDFQQLDYPETTILAHGGEIFFLLTPDGTPIGTVAMVIHGGEMELAKMSMDDAFQGKGYAHFLMREGLQWARDRKDEFNHVTIVTNAILGPAIKLYERHGFKITHEGPHPEYERANVIMHLPL